MMYVPPGVRRLAAAFVITMLNRKSIWELCSRGQPRTRTAGARIRFFGNLRPMVERHLFTTASVEAFHSVGGNTAKLHSVWAATE
jgi:hypothetical protein